jgi:hypothetical protein
MPATAMTAIIARASCGYLWKENMGCRTFPAVTAAACS